MQIKFALDSLKIEDWVKTPSIVESNLVQEVTRLVKLNAEVSVDKPDDKSLLQIYMRLNEAFTSRSNAQLSAYDINNSPWVIFQKFDEQKSLFKRWRFPGFYRSVIQNTSSRRFILAFYHSYLFSYPHDNWALEEFRKLLVSFFEQAPDKKIQRLYLEVTENNLLNKNAHIHIAQKLVDANAVESELSKIGLLGLLEGGQFTKAVFRQLFKNLKVNLAQKTPIEVERFVSSLISFFEAEEEKRLKEIKIELADSVLPAVASLKLTSEAKEVLKTFFMTHFGDPRVTLDGWYGVSEDALIVFRGWLVEKTMDDFFSLLSHVAATDSSADKHWLYRKRFWNAYLKKGYIQEAWFALGKVAYNEAPKFIKGKHNYASLTGGNANHSVLILRIGDLVITEWSHAGKYRVWDGNPLAPKFYLNHYRRDDLVDNANHEASHHGNETGGWQERLESYIFERLNIKVYPRDYMND